MKYTVQLVIASAITMALSYLLVHVLLENSEAQPPSAVVIREAQQLRDFSNELLGLTSEFLLRTRRSKKGNLGHSPDLSRWANREFGPKLNDLRQRMLLSDLAGRPYHALLVASGRTAAMGSRPNDISLRRLAILEVLAAASQAEARIEALGLATTMNPPAVTPTFGQTRQ